MSLKKDKTGLGGPDDFEVASGNDDDGEKYAGGRILKVMQTEGVLDGVGIVSRWCADESSILVPDVAPMVYFWTTQVWRRNARTRKV